ncbi:phage holin family protein [Pontibacter silvestris]|uniref:Phage holin family protein n=1 Tax=Pontibacter silvestris TaxID=2305183 RepID=A0ABW4WZ28_9BACT|nr:phage holin family protein [Pontibacter silvestris]MCC9135351.1 phage holin family protein [Pontibacter silvestris]
MDFIIDLLVSAGVLMLMAYMLPTVHIKSFWTALWVAFLVGILNATIGAIIRFPLNLFTFFLLSFLVRLVVTAIIIKFVDWLVGNFKIDGFLPALIIAVALAVAGAIVGWLTTKDEGYITMEQQTKVEQLYTLR